MPRDFYPRREADILRWTSNFRAHIAGGLGGVGPSLGLSPAQIEAYGIAQERFASLYRAAHSPTLRTPTVMQAKSGARIALEAITRELARVIGAQRNITLEMRSTLELALRRRGGYRRPLPPPSAPPRVRVQAIDGQFATLVLVDRSGGAEKRRKPRGAVSALVWSFVGDVPPANIGEWKYAGQTSRTITRLAFDAALPPGTKVWLTACWMNSRCKQSRPCEPVLTHVGYGGLMVQRLRSARMLYVSRMAKSAEVAQVATGRAGQGEAEPVVEPVGHVQSIAPPHLLNAA